MDQNDFEKQNKLCREDDCFTQLTTCRLMLLCKTLMFVKPDFSQQLLHESCAKKHNELDAVVEMLIRKILTQRIDKIGWENVTNCHMLADGPNGTNY